MEQKQTREQELKGFKLKQRICPAAHSPKGAVDSFGPEEVVRGDNKKD